MLWANILWLQLTATTRSGTDLAAVLTSLQSAWAGRFGNHTASDTSLTQVQGIWVTPGGGEIVGFNTTAAVGAVAGASVNNVATAALVNWRIDKYYRGGKPRTYVAGVPDGYCTDGVHLTSTALTNYNADANGFITAVNSITSGGITAVKLGTVSFIDADAWRSPPEFWQYLGANVRATLGTQRRRLLA